MSNHIYKDVKFDSYPLDNQQKFVNELTDLNLTLFKETLLFQVSECKF